MRICWAGSGLHNCLGSNVDTLRSVCQNPQASVAHGKCFLGVISPVSPGLTSVVRRLRTLVISYTSLTRTSPERSLGSNASRKAARVRDSTRLALIQHLSPPRNGFPSLCLASNHKEDLSMIGEAHAFRLVSKIPLSQGKGLSILTGRN